MASGAKAGFIRSIGVYGLGLPDWPSAKAVLDRSLPFPTNQSEPAKPKLKSRQGPLRSLPPSILIALTVAEEAVAASGCGAEEFHAVFSCSGGNADALHSILSVQDTDDGLVSPRQFALSGHNSTAGTWSLVSRSMHSSVSIGAFDGSVAAGFIEALSLVASGAENVLLVVSDVPPPTPLSGARAVGHSFACAFIVGSKPMPKAMARVNAELCWDAPEDRLDDVELERLSCSNPAARSLLLLAPLARNEYGRVIMPYLANTALEVTCQPCS